MCNVWHLFYKNLVSDIRHGSSHLHDSEGVDYRNVEIILALKIVLNKACDTYLVELCFTLFKPFIQISIHSRD